MERLRIVVSGLIAQHPTLGGVAWDYLQYVLGLQRLGHDVYYLEDSGEWPYDETPGAGGDDFVARDPSPNVSHLAGLMERFGMADRWAYRWATRPTWFGMPGRRRREVVSSADLLINVSGSLRRPQEHQPAGRLVYVDSDPGFTQVKLLLPRGQRKFRRRVDAHDVHFTFGETLPVELRATGHDWRPTRQPIVLDEWVGTPPPAGAAYTTVMSLTSYRPLRWRGLALGQKDVTLERYLDLPRQVSGPRLQLALGGTAHTNWQAIRSGNGSLAALKRAGWSIVDPRQVTSTIDDYRRYLIGSRGEWSIAKQGYVTARTGWFSCRSACYMAAGRPVIVQDTGFVAVLPTGTGVVAFSTPEEAAAALDDVESRYSDHASAAHEIAREYFASDRVLERLVAEAMA
jgi:hypothetical protein